MRRLLKAEVDPTGHVIVCVPPELLWEFVEYLSFQRLSSQYHYGPTHFTVVFPNDSYEAVSRVLDDWTHSFAPEKDGARMV